jgi:hypothetical protein
MPTALWVTLLVVVVLGGQALMWLLIIRSWRRTTAERRARLAAEIAEMARSGEVVAVQPTELGYRSGHVSGRATVCLTDRRLVLLSRTRHDVALDTITGVRSAKAFHGQRTGGRSFVILTLAGGAPELAIHVPHAAVDHWVAQLDAQREEFARAAAAR